MRIFGRSIRRIILPAVLVCFCAPASASNYLPDDIDNTTRLALEQALYGMSSDASKKVAAHWIMQMSKRLRHQVPNLFYRTELLGLIYREATRNELDPELVMALIEVESHFRRRAISNKGAMGLMQVMPFWIDEIGQPEDDLFFPETNIRYGCWILKHYLGRAKGDMSEALAYYNGSFGQEKYPSKVFLALQSNWQ